MYHFNLNYNFCKKTGNIWKNSLIQKVLVARKIMKKNKKKPKLYKDKNGEYIKQWYFVRGKQKFIKIYIIDGIPADEFYLQNADPITLLQDGHYELLDQINF